MEGFLHSDHKVRSKKGANEIYIFDPMTSFTILTISFATELIILFLLSNFISDEHFPFPNLTSLVSFN